MRRRHAHGVSGDTRRGTHAQRLAGPGADRAAQAEARSCDAAQQRGSQAAQSTQRRGVVGRPGRRFAGPRVGELQAQGVVRPSVAGTRAMRGS